MSSFFCITVRFLQPYTHRRAAGRDPEGPPSPLRVLKAIVAASAGRWNERMRLSYAVAALEWLERQPAPTIAAVSATPTHNPYLLYIPNNTTDLAVPAWRKGDTGKAVKREQKDVRPTHLRGGDAVHYLFSLADGACPHFDLLAAATRSITHLGWGVDMVAGNASLITDAEAAQLPGERWLP